MEKKIKKIRIVYVPHNKGYDIYINGEGHFLAGKSITFEAEKITKITNGN